MATCCFFISAFFAGFILAYTRSWRLALAMSSILPCIGLIGMVMKKFLFKYLLLSRQYVSDGGSLAEEVISTIRTAQAFGTQKALADIYDTHVIKAEKVDKAAVFRGGALAFFFFVLYSAYGLAFSFGTTLINEGHGQYGPWKSPQILGNTYFDDVIIHERTK
jgi:ATP-binding cassette, subfamily B (MDR/TAP), member 1